MSPVDFMASSETISSLKRKTRFPSITTAHVKRFRLDPSLVPEDTSISCYHDRVSKLLLGDRLKLRVMIPFEQTWDGVLDRMEKQESILSNMVTSMEEQKAMLEEQRTKLDKQDVALKNLQRRQLDLCVGNAVIEMARLVFKNNAALAADSPTHRLQQLATNVTQRQLEQSCIPEKYWPSIRSLTKVC